MGIQYKKYLHTFWSAKHLKSPQLQGCTIYFERLETLKTEGQQFK